MVNEDEILDPDALFNFDELEAEIDEEKVTQKLQEGYKSGVEKGIRSGAKDAVAPKAEKAAKKIMREIIDGKSPLRDTATEMANVYQIEAIQQALENMRAKKNAPSPQQVTHAAPEPAYAQTLEKLKLLHEMGVKVPEEAVQQAIALSDPMLAMAFQKKAEPQSNDNTMGMLQLVQMMMQRQQPPAGEPAGGNGMTELLGIMLQGQMEDKRTMQAKADMLQQQQLQQLVGMLQQEPQEDPLDKLSGEMAKLGKLKEMLGWGDSQPRSAAAEKMQLLAAQSDIAIKQRQHQFALDMEKLKRERELRLVESENKQQQNQEIINLFKTGAELLKSLNIGESAEKVLASVRSAKEMAASVENDVFAPPLPTEEPNVRNPTHDQEPLDELDYNIF